MPKEENKEVKEFIKCPLCKRWLKISETKKCDCGTVFEDGKWKIWKEVKEENNKENKEENNEEKKEEKEEKKEENKTDTFGKKFKNWFFGE